MGAAFTVYFNLKTNRGNLQRTGVSKEQVCTCIDATNIFVMPSPMSRLDHARHHGIIDVTCLTDLASKHHSFHTLFYRQSFSFIHEQNLIAFGHFFLLQIIHRCLCQHLNRSDQITCTSLFRSPVPVCSDHLYQSVSITSTGLFGSWSSVYTCLFMSTPSHT